MSVFAFSPQGAVDGIFRDDIQCVLTLRMIPPIPTLPLDVRLDKFAGEDKSSVRLS